MTIRPRLHRAFFLSLIIGSLLGASAALAADQIVPLPEKWRLAPELFGASIENTALPLQSVDVADGSRILQVRGGQMISTELPGAVTAIAYSFDGRFLLVHHTVASPMATITDDVDTDAVPIEKSGRAAVAPASATAPLAEEAVSARAVVRAKAAAGGTPEAEIAPAGAAGTPDADEAQAADGRRVSLINAEGAILWTKTDGRTFEFSTTGEVVVASSEEPGTGLRSNVEVFDLTGKTVRTLPIASRSADAALVLADGKKAALVVERSLLGVDFTQDGAILWRHDFSRSDPDFVKLFSLAPDKIVLQLAEGRFKLFQPSGVLAYDYDPATIALTYPEMTEAEARQLAPEAGPNPCSLTVFSGSPHARQIHLASSKIYEKYVSLEAPGYKRVTGVMAGKMVFVSPASVLIRSLKDEFKAPTADLAP